MKIRFNQIFDLERCLLLLLSTCLFCCFTGLKAMNLKVAKNNIPAWKRTTTIIENDNNEISFFLSDTLPGLIKKEKSQDWEVLFNGENTDKWRGVGSNTFPSNGWVIEKGSLFLNREGSGDIITREKFSNFELVLDFNLTNGANSGIKYFVGHIKNIKTGKVVINGPEYQIIDDFNNPEVKDHKHDLGATASCYLLYAPVNVRLLPPGQWNHVSIIAKGKHVEHWLNNVKVLEYERGSEDFLKRKATTKFKDYQNYGELSSGHILLTDHIDKVYFKNIKIRRL